ncbi:hypothetical protein SSYRP_v1c07040 [Spiroplasma syrphidicola EA-1]|uniref:Uncharacterized protein n=1 Tax=Spiroplasma syrphidicola EA-1 TaxID=1276229 RepID=R4UED8_9MOLU|nr:hypothetical protein [Spiroplasma syrphidicola]AGM26294.1 hypothetical protein SSYRP_v1c07040 [Spiroplasma syrphidicola EA-1]
MKHLLNIFSVVALATSTASATLIKDYNFSENTLLNRSSTIDLENVNLNGGEINLYKIKDKFDDDAIVTKTILMGLLPLNKGNDAELKKVIANSTKNFDNWIVDLPELPELEHVINNVSMTLLYVGSDYEFENYLTINDLILTNYSLNEKQDLNNVVKENIFNDLKVLSETSLTDEIIKANSKYGVKREDFEISEIWYDYAIISATETSNYKGNVTIIYNDVYEKVGHIESGVVKTNVYNSHHEDAEVKTLDVDVALGKEAFLKKYSSMSYVVTGYTDNNGRGEEGGRRELNSITGENVTYKDLNLKSNSDNNVIFTRDYSSTNWNKARGEISVRWISDKKIEIQLVVHTEAWATAWNAYWSRVEAQAMISEIKFF